MDIQFGACLDEVQLKYFSDVAASQLQPGDRIILCMGNGVESGRKEVEVHSDWNVVYLAREVIQSSGDRILSRSTGAGVGALEGASRPEVGLHVPRRGCTWPRRRTARDRHS